MSPKIVNGSFAAIYDTADVFEECMKTFGKINLEARDSPGKYLIYCMIRNELLYLLDKCFNVCKNLFTNMNFECIKKENTYLYLYNVHISFIIKQNQYSIFIDQYIMSCLLF